MNQNLISAGLRLAIEALVLLMLSLSPWAFGSADPLFRLVISTGIAALLILWAVRIVVMGALSWKMCPVFLCLAALFFLGVCQMLALSRGAVNWLAPSTNALYDELVPSVHESIDADSSFDFSPGTATLSLYPGATFRFLVQLTAVLALFAVVRNNIDPVGGLRRLSYVVLVNGTLLAIFGILQRFSSPPDTIYWTFKSPGTVFGPFINRNHFAFYLNICIGLGLGVLLHQSSDVHNETSSEWSLSTVGQLLRKPTIAWTCVAIIFMMTAVAFSLSRGGILALLGGLGVFSAIALRRPGYLAAGMIVLVVALVLVLWLGPEPIVARLATLGDTDKIEAGRLALWSHAWPLVRDFPIWGTGYGTFSVVEPLHRTSLAEAGRVAVHAENEYLEALVEGGVIRLVLTLVGLALVAYLAFRNLRARQPGSGQWGLLLGGLVAFSTVVVHSFFDFGLHIPAITLLATVLFAYLVGDHAQAQGESAESADTVELRVWGLAPAAGALVMILIGWFLYHQADRAWTVNRYRTAAHQLRGSDDPANLERRIAFLTAAARLGPDYALVYSELGQAQSEYFELKKAALQRDATARRVAREVLANAAPATTLYQRIGSVAAAVYSSDQEIGADIEELRQAYLVPGLRCYLYARDLCPVLPQPHLRIAFNVGLLAKADPRSSYLERAQYLLPYDPEIWYVSGLLALMDGDRDRAKLDWQHSLEQSDRFLPDMIELLRRSPDPDDFLTNLLPPKPDLWVYVGLRHFASDNLKRRFYLEKALSLLDRGEPSSGEELRLRGLAEFGLGHPEKGKAAYAAALAREPGKIEWRYELVAQLLSQGMTLEASRQLRVASELAPNNPEGRKLRQAVNEALQK